MAVGHTGLSGAQQGTRGMLAEDGEGCGFVATRDLGIAYQGGRLIRQESPKPYHGSPLGVITVLVTVPSEKGHGWRVLR